jgi:hypothetical protein
LVDSCPPIVPSPGVTGVDFKFDTWQALRVHADRLRGLLLSTTNTTKISTACHNILSIPLKRHEYKSVVHFIDQIKGIPFNRWDTVLSRTATLIPSGMIQDIVLEDSYNVCKSVTCVHAPQLTALILRYCIDNNRAAHAKLWGFNSRLITANEIFEQLRVTCTALDADALSRYTLRALSEGVTTRCRD